MISSLLVGISYIAVVFIYMGKKIVRKLEFYNMGMENNRQSKKAESTWMHPCFA